MMKKMRKYLTAILLLGVISILIPILIVSFYAVPSADDFSNSLNWVWYGNGISSIGTFVSEMYMTWQGTYFGLLLCGIPLYYLSGLIGLRIFIFIVILLFLGMTYLLIYSFVNFFNFAREDVHFFSLTVYFVILFCLLGNNDMEEIFYWYTGICVYTIPMILVMLSVCLLLRYKKNNCGSCLVCAVLMAILGAGGSLNISAFLCSVLLFLVVYDVVVKHAVRGDIIVFIFAFLGSVVNAIAPGNYMRHGYFDSKFDISLAIENTVHRIFSEISLYFRMGLLLVLAIFIIVFCSKKLRNCHFDFRYPGLVTLYGITMLVVVDFPVAFGYSSNVFPSRVEFVELFAILFYVMLCSIYWGGWIARNNVLEFNNTAVFILIVICMMPLSVYLDIDYLNGFIPYKMKCGLEAGNYKLVADMEEDIVNQIESSDLQDVVVYTEEDPEGLWVNIKRLSLVEEEDDPGYWFNKVIAQYYNKNSVILSYKKK